MATFSRDFSSFGGANLQKRSEGLKKLTHGYSSHPHKMHLYLKVLGQNKKKGDHPGEETHTVLINMYAYKYIAHTYIYIYNHIWAFAFLSFFIVYTHL